jgi:hypothetical protein
MKHRVQTLLRLFIAVSALIPQAELTPHAVVNAQGTTTAEQVGKKITTSGLVDFYYGYNFAQPSSRTNKLRNFDTDEQQLNVSLAELVVQMKAEPIGFRIDADFGPTNDAVQGGVNTTLSYLQQAYITAVIPVGAGLTVDVGKFVTHMGFEVIESKDNWNYSRSLLFAWAIPYFHVGLRVNYPVLSNVTLSGHLCNGWNTIADNNTEKTFGATLNIMPTSSLTIIQNWIGGREQLSDGSGVKRNVFDLILIYQLTDALALALNADYGEDRGGAGVMLWKGIAAYGRYSFNEQSAIVIRGEVFSDPNGYAMSGFVLGGIAQEVKAVTATYERKFLDALLLRLEYRHDWSNKKFFDKQDQPNSIDYQDTILFGAVVMF